MDAQFVEYIDVDGWEDEAREWESNNSEAKHHIYGILLSYEYKNGEESDVESDEEEDGEKLPGDTGPRLKHIYAPPNVVKVDDFFKWTEETKKKYEERGRNLVPTYYKLNQYFICRVETSPEWFEKNFQSMKDVWERIEYANTPEGQEYFKNLKEEKATKKSEKQTTTKKNDGKAVRIDIDVSGALPSVITKNHMYVYETCLL